MSRSITLRLAATAFIFAVRANAQQTASTDVAAFTVGDIRIEGLQRITEGTVYNYLPVNIGDVLDRRHIAEAIRAIYATGFFRYECRRR